MYLRRFNIRNIRSISGLEMDFPRGQEAGWHVILGPNGSGKSTIVRSFALLMMGEREAYASRQDFNRWLGRDKTDGVIDGQVTYDPVYDILSSSGQPPKKPIRPKVTLHESHEGLVREVDVIYAGELVNRTIWGAGAGWFAASFGPFRRFTGGDRIYDRLFVSNRRLAPHLSALGEDVALTEALGWLASLHVQQFQDDRSGQQPSYAGRVLALVLRFLNESHFLPHGARIHAVTNDRVLVKDGNGAIVFLDQLSDGYRSALSLTLELVRQMFELYGTAIMEYAMTYQPGIVYAPGIVAIDEVDAHLHPSWQRDIGQWLTKHFPLVQFIVTTHSPIVCRAVLNDVGEIRGSIWRLPAPGSDEKFRRIEDEEFDSLAYGDVLDAFGTELFGTHITRSEAGFKKLGRLAELNHAALDRSLTDAEKAERKGLRRIFSAEAGRLDPPVF